MPGTEPPERLAALRQRRVQCDLDQTELLELYDLEKQFSPNYYGLLVAALSTFPPYLAKQPGLIPVFVEGLHAAWLHAFRGSKVRREFEEFLGSKAHVDGDLGAAMAAHPAEFERAINRSFQ